MASPARLVELLPGAWVTTSRRYSTTSTVLLDGVGGAVVVDPAWDPDELAAIPSDLSEMGVRCVAGVATHEHYDHVLWHPDLGRVPRWASPGTVARLAAAREQLLAPLADYLPPDLMAVAGRLDPLPGDRVPWAGPDILVVTHDAHAPAHLALLVEGSGLLLSGDMLSDVELPMPAEGDVSLDVYIGGLDRLREVVRRASWLVPGHGSPTDRPMARFDADMRYLDALLAGRPSRDVRISDPANADLHAANLRRARADGGH